MEMNIFEIIISIYNHLSTSGWLFLLTIVALTIVAFYKKQHRSKFRTAVTSIGILGTFLGIITALLAFNTEQIDEGIPELIGGLKFAFFTSIFGLVASLVIQAFPIFDKKTKEDKENINEKEILAEVLKEVKELNKNVAGEGDASLSTQLLKMRTDNNDRHKELKKSLDEFAETMAKSNTEALIESIQKVMEDFNTKINDQLGDSFRELSSSVTNLVEWQNQYKEQIDNSTKALIENQKALKKLLKIKESLQTVSESLKEAVKDYDKFGDISVELKRQLEAMAMFITEIKELAGTLKGSGNEMKNEIQTMVNESMKGIKRASSDFSQEISSTIKRSVEVLAKSSGRLMEETGNQMKEITMKSLASFGENLVSITDKMTSDFQRIQKALENTSKDN